MVGQKVRQNIDISGAELARYFRRFQGLMRSIADWRRNAHPPDTRHKYRGWANSLPLPLHAVARPTPWFLHRGGGFGLSLCECLIRNDPNHQITQLIIVLLGSCQKAINRL